MSYQSSILFLALLIAAAVAMNTPPLYTAKGTYYEVGVQVGVQAKVLIHQRLSVSNATWSFLVNTPEALLFNQTMYQATVESYPELIEELLGIASGSGLSFAQVFFLNTMTELEQLQAELSPQTVYHPIGHCTDVIATGELPEATLWGHNEDSGLHDCNNTYMVNATIVVGGVVVEQFIAYTYAASVAGRAFGWNTHGIIISTNALFSNNAAFDVPFALPRAIHNRALYRSHNVEEAITFAIGKPSIVSFSLNIGTWDLRPTNSFHKSPAQYYNIEVNTNGGHSVTPVFPRRAIPSWVPNSMPRSSQFHFYHANNFEVLIANAINDTSSTARMNRLREFPVPVTHYDVRAMLGDTKNATWPVWQNNSDGLFTMATAIFHFESQSVAIFAGNPKISEAVYVLPGGFTW